MKFLFSQSKYKFLSPDCRIESKIVITKINRRIFQVQRLSLIELTNLTREMGNSIEKTLDAQQPKVTIPAARNDKER